jgi:arsenate reductase
MEPSLRKDATMNPALKALFLCTGNSCRSQMAEAWARELKGGIIEPYSAGIEPRGVDPRTVEVMAEAGLDVSEQRSKHVDELRHIEFDCVATLCDHAAENCPVFPGKTRVVHVSFEDPPRLAAGAATEEEALGHYRRIRDEIREWIDRLPEALPGADEG